MKLKWLKWSVNIDGKKIGGKIKVEEDLTGISLNHAVNKLDKEIRSEVGKKL